MARCHCFYIFTDFNGHVAGGVHNSLVSLGFYHSLYEDADEVHSVCSLISFINEQKQNVCDVKNGCHGNTEVVKSSLFLIFGG